MEAREIIELHELGFLDQHGNICEETVGEIGYEDGETLGDLCCDLIPCGCEVALLEVEGQLKRDYYLRENKEFVEVLHQVCRLFNFELSEDVSAMCMNNEIIDLYLQHFLIGYADMVLERLKSCRECRRGR